MTEKSEFIPALENVVDLPTVYLDHEIPQWLRTSVKMSRGRREMRSVEADEGLECGDPLSEAAALRLAGVPFLLVGGRRRVFYLEHQPELGDFHEVVPTIILMNANPFVDSDSLAMAPFRALFRVLRAAHVDVPEEELGDGVSTFADLAGRSGGYSCGRYVGKWAPRWFLVQRLPAGAFLPSYPDQQLNTPIPARNLVMKGIDP